MTTEEKAKAYDEGLKRAKAAIDIAADKDLVKGVATTIFPELRESEDERIRKDLIVEVQSWQGIPESKRREYIAYLEKQKESLHISETCKENADSFTDDEKIRKVMLEHFKSKTKETWCNMPVKDIIFYLEKLDAIPDELVKNYKLFCEEGRREAAVLINAINGINEQQPVMFQWTGKNLKEVIDFTGKSPKFGEWFKSWDEFEEYVHTHNDILKLFCEDGSHYEVPIGAWIVKTPDGYNTPSRFRFIQKPAEWSDTNELVFQDICKHLENEGYSGWVVLLNALRNGEFNPPTKQGWSKEDEEMLNLTKTQLRILQSHLSQTHSESMPDMEYSSQLLQIEKCVSWLDIRFKSLRPQLSNEDIKKIRSEEYTKGFNDAAFGGKAWKPSEEQIGALNYAYCELFKRGDVGHNILGPLQKLIDQLKKQI